MRVADPPRRPAWLIPTCAFLAYVVIAALYTRPLLERSFTDIASDKYDPVLNASILWWNATTLPFSAQWWTPPHYYPVEGIAAFTENLVGLVPVSAPLYWLTGDPVFAYNLTLFLTWPLSGLAVFLLVLRLTRQRDAAFIAGLTYAFAPYRVAQLAHLQVLACYWLPVALLSLHAYLDDGRRRWLILFGTAWVLQSLSNGYYMLFGGVLIALWLAYFCFARGAWRFLPPIVAAWMVASLPLLPVLLEYRQVHGAFGLERGYDVAVLYSARAKAWGSVSNLVWFWGSKLDLTGGEATLFPGITAAILILGALGWSAFRPTGALQDARRRIAGTAAGVIAAVALALVLATLVAGPWRITMAGITIRMSSIDRALWIALISAAAWLWLSANGRHVVASRSPFVFYTAATVAMMLFSMGPEVRVGSTVVVETAPYYWLMSLPGFSGLRVPARFWMLGALCLATAAGLGYARLAPAHVLPRALLFVAIAGGVLLDGWIREMPMVPRPELWTQIERRDRQRALLELPLGPEWDAAATFRAVRHRRRVVNGVSGYDPPHYAPLQRGLADSDPSILTALASLGPIEVVVNGAADDGALHRYVASFPGVQQVQEDGERTLFRLPSVPAHGEAGEMLPIKAVSDSTGLYDLGATIDGDVRSGWADNLSRPVGSILLDLGASKEIETVTVTVGSGWEAFPRRLAVDVSENGLAWAEVWQGNTIGAIVLAAMREPRLVPIAFPLARRTARFVRLRAIDRSASWAMTEIRLHAPVGNRPVTND
jgi:hypothetical protein